MKKVVCALLSTLMILGLVSCGSNSGQNSNPGNASGTDSDKVYEMKCSTFVNSGAPELDLLQAFADNMYEKSDGHIKMTIYPGEQLGGYEQTFEETMRGTIEFGINSTAASFDNRLSASNLTGGIYSDYDVVTQVIAPGSTLYNTISDAMDGLGLKFLGFFPGGYYNICLNTEPPANYADPNTPKNETIRVNSYEVTNLVIQALGYRTATLPGAELYTGLETGIVDGCTGLDYGLVLNGYSDVVSNIIETKHFMSMDSVFMNKKLFDSMPTEYQTIIEECALEFQLSCIEFQKDLESTVKPQLEEKGIHIFELTDEEHAAIDAKLQAEVWPYYVEQFGQEFLDGVKADAGLA